MAFSAIVRALGRSHLTQELLTQLDQSQVLDLNGLPRLPKGLLASAIAFGGPTYRTQLALNRATVAPSYSFRIVC
jgi:hypothetical protein